MYAYALRAKESDGPRLTIKKAQATHTSLTPILLLGKRFGLD